MNKFNLEQIIRPNIKKLTPYSSARDEFSGVAEIYLDANENALGSIGSADNHRYPDPMQKELKEGLAKLEDINPANIFLGVGSDEIIDLLIRAFCFPGRDKTLIMPPTFGMYEVSSQINDIEVLSVPLKSDFSVDEEAVWSAIRDEKLKLIFFCTPNNPSGSLVNPDFILQIARNFRGLVVVDEAYADFAETVSLTKYHDQYPNLVILKTFSKAWGLAAIRLGMGFMSESIVKILNKIKQPGNISTPTQLLALQALDFVEEKQKKVDLIVAERNQLAIELTKLSYVETVFPSQANFLLVRFNQARAVYSYLAQNQIITRDRSKTPGCENCLRITIGTPAENRKLLKELKSFTKDQEGEL